MYEKYLQEFNDFYSKELRKNDFDEIINTFKEEKKLKKRRRMGAFCYVLLFCLSIYFIPSLTATWKLIIILNAISITLLILHILSLGDLTLDDFLEIKISDIIPNFIDKHIKNFEHVYTPDEENISTLYEFDFFDKVTKCDTYETIVGQYKDIDFAINYISIKGEASDVKITDEMPLYMYTIKCNSKHKYTKRENKTAYENIIYFISYNFAESTKIYGTTGEAFDKYGNFNMLMTTGVNSWINKYNGKSYNFETRGNRHPSIKEILESHILYQHIKTICALINIIQDCESKTEEEIQHEIELIEAKFEEESQTENC